MTSLEGKELCRNTYPDRLEDQLETLKTDEAVQRFTKSREQLSTDPYRPLYHFSPPENMMNDPNGLCFWQGHYHLFYQFRPSGIERVHWGHTVSENLVHWRDLPIALYPDQEKDCFSGQTVVEPDRVIATYHGTQSGNCIAMAWDPLLLNWTKHADNPVIPIVPVDEKGAPYRVFDPCIWEEDDGYYALSGTYVDGAIRVDCRNVDYLFRSRDLADWEFLGPLIEDGFYTEPGEDGAVPNFWPIGNGKHMLLFFSHKRAAQYYVGEYEQTTHRLTPDYHGRMNYGPLTMGSLHAPSATIDDRGRFLAIFNVKDGLAAGGMEQRDDPAAALMVGRRQRPEGRSGGRGRVASGRPSQSRARDDPRKRGGGSPRDPRQGDGDRRHHRPRRSARGRDVRAPLPRRSGADADIAFPEGPSGYRRIRAANRRLSELPAARRVRPDARDRPAEDAGGRTLAPARLCRSQPR